MKNFDNVFKIIEMFNSEEESTIDLGIELAFSQGLEWQVLAIIQSRSRQREEHAVEVIVLLDFIHSKKETYDMAGHVSVSTDTGLLFTEKSLEDFLESRRYIEEHYYSINSILNKFYKRLDIDNL